MRPPTVQDLSFRPPVKGPGNVEIIVLEELYRRGVEHVLQRPQRLQFFMMMLMTRGRGEHMVDFVRHRYDGRTLFFVARGQVQQFRIDLASRGLLLVFTPDFLYRNATEADVQLGLRVFDGARESPRWRLGQATHARFREMFEQIRRETARPADGLSEEIVRHQVRLILLEAERLRRLWRPEAVTAGEYGRYVALRDLVRREMSRSRSVEFYARKLGTTPRGLNRLTRLVLNRGAKAFIAEEVVQEARRLLASGGLAVKEVGYRLGFSEPTNWVKFFRRHAGESPASFRRRLRC